VEDLKCIALERCFSQKDSVMKSLDDTFAIAMKGRSKAFSVSKFSYNMTDSLDKLTDEKRINLNLDIKFYVKFVTIDLLQQICQR
jgi:hypothetical protein